MESGANGEAICFWNLEKLKLRGTEMGDIAVDSMKKWSQAGLKKREIKEVTIICWSRPFYKITFHK